MDVLIWNTRREFGDFLFLDFSCFINYEILQKYDSYVAVSVPTLST